MSGPVRGLRTARADGGHIHVLEAVLAAAVLLAVAGYAAMQPTPGETGAFASHETAQFTHDVLQVLAGVPSGDAVYASLLHEYVTDAIRGEPDDLAAYMERMLPPGADYGVYLDNGQALEHLVETSTPSDEVGSESLVFYSDWSYALAFATLDRQPGASVVTTSTCTPPPLSVCTPTAATAPAGTLHVKVVPVKHGYIDRDASGSLVFGNGHSVALVAGVDHVLSASGITPESPAAPAGFDTPYDVSGEAAYAASVAAAASGAATAYEVDTTLPYRLATGPVYSVHPNYAASASMQAYMDAGPHLVPGAASVRPGERILVHYDYDDLPLPSGWSVQSRELRVYGPALGNLITAEPLAGLSGDWTWDVPRSALYGTHTVEVRITMANGAVEQTLHDVTAFDVLRRGVEGPVPPVYRVVAAVWFDAT